MSFPDNASLTAGREGREYVRQRNARGYQQQFPDHASYVRYLSGVSYVQAQRRAAPIPFTEPINVTGTPEIGSARIAFDAPISTGGAPIVSYKVIAMPGNITVTGASSPILVTGLTLGQTYTFTVSAYNGKNTSPPSTITAPVSIATAPVTAPLITIDSGDSKLTVSVTPPTDNGGSPITGYKYSLNNGMLQDVPTLSNDQFEINGLMNGTSYTVSLLAVNAVGDGPSSPAVTGIPLGVPQAPLIAVANTANKLRITVTPPSDTGGSTITGYKYSLDGGSFQSVTLTASNEFEITGLINGRTYTVSVLASNIVGDGAGSTPPSKGTPVTVPAAPRAAVARGNAKLTVSVTPPADDGGSAITGYKYSLDGGATQNVTGLANNQFDITGLTNGTSYSVRILAVNAMGDGAISSAVSGTPVGAPDPPRNVRATPGNKKATVAFDIPVTDGGRTITSYTVIAAPGEPTATGSASPIEVTGLTNGTSYTFTVVATNSEGNSEPSSASSAIKPDAGARQIFDQVGNGTWTVPDGVTTIEYLIVGGGGGGGSGSGTGAGGGGGGGSVKIGTLTVTPGASIAYTVGAGGAGGAGSATSSFNGVDGDYSSFASIIAAGGGLGYNNSNKNSSGKFGAGGNAQNGDTPTTGGSGGQVRDKTSWADKVGGGGGGGGAGGPGSNGVTGVPSTDNARGGAGGIGIKSNLADGIHELEYGKGGKGADEGTSVYIGTAPGAVGTKNTGNGGGGGASHYLGNNGAPGGAGGSGIIVLKYSLP